MTSLCAMLGQSEKFVLAKLFSCVFVSFSIGVVLIANFGLRGSAFPDM